MTYRFDWTVVWTYRDLLLSGALGTIELFLPAAILSILSGILIGALKSSRVEILRDVARYYVLTFRNIPVVVILFFLYFAYKLNPYTAAVIGLAIHHGAYMAEVTEAGIRSCARTLRTTALASGFSSFGSYRYVILPVAFRIMLPPLTTQMLELLKNTSVAMTISFAELTFSVSIMSDETFRGFEAATAATLVYALMALVLIAVMNRVETRLKVRV